MGCGGSRLGHGNAGMVLPPRLRPLFLLRLEEFKMRRRARPLRDPSSTTSKLLLHERDEDENSSVIFGRKLYEEKQQEKEHGKPKLEEVCERNEHKDYGNIKDMTMKEESEFEDALTDAYNDDDDDDDMEDEEGRMIGAFPGSPSFRVYFKDDGEDKHKDLGNIKNNAFKSTSSSDDDTVSLKESCDLQNKKVKRGRKKKSFRKVLPKGGQAAVKNLLSVNLCYTSSPSAHHHHSHASSHRKNNGLIR